MVRGDLDVDFDYQVNGVREAYRDYRVQQPNQSFRPRIADEPYGEHLRPDVRALLVENGILNHDFTPNRATAAALGWDLAERDHLNRTRPELVRPMDPRLRLQSVEGR